MILFASLCRKFLVLKFSVLLGCIFLNLNPYYMVLYSFLLVLFLSAEGLVFKEIILMIIIYKLELVVLRDFDNFSSFIEFT